MKLHLLGLALISLLLIACGGDDAPAATDASPQELLAKSATAVQDVTTLHFRLTHENGTTPMPLNLQLVTAEGDIVLPDRLAAKLNARAASVSVSLDVIGIADRTWITNPFTRRWQTLPEATIQDVADPAALVASLLDSLDNPQVAGSSEIDDVSTVHITGTMDSGALEGALPIAHAGLTVNVDLWIGEDDSLPRRVRLNGPIASDDAEKIVRQVDFSDYNARVDIQPPE